MESSISPKPLILDDNGIACIQHYKQVIADKIGLLEEDWKDVTLGEMNEVVIDLELLFEDLYTMIGAKPQIWLNRGNHDQQQ